MKINRDDIYFFTRELTLLLKSGSSEVRALEQLGRQDVTSNLKELIDGLVDRMISGYSLSESLEERMDMFPPGYTEIIAAGEESGALPEILEEYIESLRHETAFRKEMKSLLLYPSIILTIGGILLGMVSVYSILYFDDFNFMLEPGAVIFSYIGAGLSVCMALFPFLFWTDVLPLSRWFLRVINLVPSLRNIIIRLFPVSACFFLTRTAIVFSVCCKAGMRVKRIVDILDSHMSFMGIKDLFSSQKKGLAQGEQLSEALLGSVYFPLVFPEIWLRVIEAGEDSGDLQGAFEKLRDIYTHKTRGHARMTAAFLQPMLLGGTALGVGLALQCIMRSILFPLISLMEAAGSSGGGHRPDVREFVIDNIFLVIIAVVSMLIWSYLFTFFERLHAKRVIFLELLRNLLSYKLTFNESIDIISRESRYFRKRIDSLAFQLEEGIPLHAALTARQYRLLPSHIWGILMTGMNTGELDHAIETSISTLDAGIPSVSYFWERFCYAGLLLLSGFVMFDFIVFVIMPKFTRMFNEMSISIEPLGFVLRYAQPFLIVLHIAVIGLIGLILFLTVPYMYYMTPSFTRLRERILAMVPFLGTAVRHERNAAFFSMLYALLRSESSERNAIEKLRQGNETGWIQHACTQILDRLEFGESLQEVLKYIFKRDRLAKLYSDTFTAVKGKGFTASIDNVSRIARMLNERTIFRASQIIPPVCYIGFSLLVGFFVWCMFYPFILLTKSMVLW